MADEKIESKIKLHGDLKLGHRKVFKSRYTSLLSLPVPFVENFLGEHKIVELTLLRDGSLKIVAVPNVNNSKGD